VSDGQLDLRIGVDVGGTNTDAVVLDTSDEVVAKTKSPTTADVTGGVRAALEAVLDEVDNARVTHVMLGTTHATNAVVERQRLKKVAVVRIGGAATDAVRPLFGWPDDLRRVVSAGEAVVAGGCEFDGRETTPFDADTTARFLTSVAGHAEAVAVTSVFSPVSAEHELAARNVAHAVLGPDVPVSLSHDIGALGIIERENSTVLNASLGGVVRAVASALSAALAAHAISPVVLFAQNDGTLTGRDHAVRNPVLTIGSGPANSLRGAAFLTGLTDTLVADVGGTTTDIGMLVGGFPRDSSLPVEIGGIRTNFRMPDILTIGVGGGTVVHPAPRIGPDSVGHRLSRESLVFGGSTPTLTDAAVAVGRASIGTHVPAEKWRARLRSALSAADVLVADAVDRLKVGRAEWPLVVVGGGSVLLPDTVPGISKVLRPDHHDVANAIGAAIAEISGTWDEIIPLDERRADAIEAAGERAAQRAVAAGADPDEVRVVELDETPLAYMTEPAARVRVKASGPLSRLWWRGPKGRGTCTDDGRCHWRSGRR
jgi:N-methylhydantoinase A/oxoprolinase/acetone carboxylase beta subunit